MPLPSATPFCFSQLPHLVNTLFCCLHLLSFHSCGATFSGFPSVSLSRTTKLNSCLGPASKALCVCVCVMSRKCKIVCLVLEIIPNLINWCTFGRRCLLRHCEHGYRWLLWQPRISDRTGTRLPICESAWRARETTASAQCAHMPSICFHFLANHCFPPSLSPFLSR